MPVSNTSTESITKSSGNLNGKSKISEKKQCTDKFLTIAPALPILPGAPIPPKLSKRSYSSLSSTHSTPNIENVGIERSSSISLQSTEGGRMVVATRSVDEREKNPDRICLDRRGLTTFPNIIGESKLRLLSLQHNLIAKIEEGHLTALTKLVFLDLYDNQIERVLNLDSLKNLRVLLMGKNRIKRIDGLRELSKLEVLDFHGNQIQQITGLEDMACLKVLNLAGNNIKTVRHNDFQGLTSLKELNLRRNKIRKLCGLDHTPQLQKLYLSNNDVTKIEDIESVTKALQIREITIDGNPITLNGDYISFLVSFLPHLQLLSSMVINEQIRRTAAAWRTVKEQHSANFLDLSTQICMNVQREEVICNAKTNWELFRSRTKSFFNSNNNNNNNNQAKHDDISMLRMQNSSKFHPIKRKTLDKGKSKNFGSLTSINNSVEANRIQIKRRSNSTDNLLDNVTKDYPLEFKLPPILGSIVNNLINDKMSGNSLNVDDRCSKDISKNHGDNVESDSNSDSENSESHESLKSGLRSYLLNSNDYPSSDGCVGRYKTEEKKDDQESSKYSMKNSKSTTSFFNQDVQNPHPKLNTSSFEYCSSSSKASSVDSCKSLLSDCSVTSTSKNQDKSRIKSAQVKKTVYYKSNRAATARAKYRASVSSNPVPQQNSLKEREQGGDYLIEIVGRCLNVYGQGALNFIDKPWDSSKAEDVNMVKFNYMQFNGISMILSKLKNRFPNVEHFVFKETNISYLGQLNALAEVQGLTSIQLESEGNPIFSKDWKSYAIFRLAHWGLKIINGKEITQEEIELANQEYSGLIDIVISSLPESLLQPLLQKLHLERILKQNGKYLTAKQFLCRSDPALRNVVAKEALQWRKTNVTQEDLIWRHKGKIHMCNLIQLTVDAIQKLQLLDREWPSILYEIIRNALEDFSDIDMYMKSYSQMLEFNK